MRGLRRAVAGAALLGASLLPSSSNGRPFGDVGYGLAEGPTFEVVALDNRFEPEVVRARAGEETTIEIPNQGREVHDFQVEGLRTNTGPIDAGQAAHARFEVPEGTTTFVCTLHPGMEGRIQGM